MNFSKTILIGLTAGLMACASAASASTLTIDFEGDAGDGGELVNNEPVSKYYAVDGYILDPVNLQGGLCFEDPGPGSCTIESTQTIEPTLFREDGTDFDLLGFYFLNNGAGAEFDNRTTVTAYNADDEVIDYFDFFIGLSLDMYEADGVTVFVAPDSPTGNCDDLATVLCKGTGYIVDLGDTFNDVNYVIWSAEGDANARLDNLVVRQDIPPIPLPAGAWLLISGLGGLAAFKRLRRKPA